MATSKVRRNRPPDVLGPVGVGAGDRHLAVPERGQVDGDATGHPHEHHAAPGPHHGEGLGQRLVAPDAVDHHVRPAGERPRRLERARAAPHGPHQLVGVHHHVGAELLGQPPLVRVPRPHEQLPGPRPGGPGPPRCTGRGCPPRARPRCGRRRPGPPTAACTAHAVGSTITASSSESSSGTGCSWASWATRPPADHPPPVSLQNPICRPGARWPKATRSHPPVRPSAHAAHGGTMPRATQPRTGSITTRASVSSRVPTTSWPGTKGKLTTSSK